MDQDMINNYEEYMNDPNTDPTYKVLAKSIMYSLFAVNGVLAISNSLIVILVVGKLALKNFGNECKRLVSDYETQIQWASIELEQARSDLFDWNSGVKTPSPFTNTNTGILESNCTRCEARLEGFVNDKRITITQQGAANTAAESVAPQLIAIMTGVSVAAGVAETIADHYLED